MVLKEMSDILGLVVFFGPFGIIGAGRRGVIYTFGAITGEKSEGLYGRNRLCIS